MATDKNIFDKSTAAGTEQNIRASRRASDRVEAKSIIGYEIRNPEGEDLGKVENFMINLQKGEIEYVVIEFGSFLGLGGKLFAVPFGALKLDEGQKVFILNRDKEYLKKAPGFDKNHWPATNDHSYFNNVTMYYGSYLPPFP